MLFCLLPLAACGWAEWPPPGRVVAVAPPPRLATGLTKAPPTVVVAQGDSVFGLSRRYNLPVRAIIEANNLKPPYVLQPGQRIQMPQAVEHEVQTGETLYSVSRQYGVDTFGVARLNGLEPPYLIRPGQRLQIPIAAGDVPAAATAAAVETVPPPAPVTSAAVTSAPVASAPVSAPAAEPQPVTAPPTDISPAVAALPKEQPVTVPPAAALTAGSQTVSSSGFIWPLRGKVASSFGVKARGLHNDGINVLAPKGSPVLAARDGVVAYAGSELKGFGNLLLVKHDNGWVSAYAHNDELMVKTGDKVRRGQPIARVGSTGSVSEPQLHFELRLGKKAVDPMDYLPKNA